MLAVLDSPSVMSWLLGCVVMTVGVVLPIGYMIYKNKMPSSAAMQHYQ